MKLKLKKKTRKRLRRLARRVGRVSGALASEMLSEMVASFFERGTASFEEAVDRRQRASHVSNGHRRELPRTADQS